MPGKPARTLGPEVKAEHIGLMLEAGYGSAGYRSARDDGVFLGAVMRLYSARIR